MPISFQLRLECSHELRRGYAGELAFFEEDAGVVEGQAAVFEVEPARDVVREVLCLGEAQELAYHIEGRGACLNGDDGLAESRDRDGGIAQSAGQPFPVEIERKVDAVASKSKSLGLRIRRSTCSRCSNAVPSKGVTFVTSTSGGSPFMNQEAHPTMAIRRKHER